MFGRKRCRKGGRTPEAGPILNLRHSSTRPRSNLPSERGAHKTVRTKIGSWLSGDTSQTLHGVYFSLGSGSAEKRCRRNRAGARSGQHGGGGSSLLRTTFSHGNKSLGKKGSFLMKGQLKRQLCLMGTNLRGNATVVLVFVPRFSPRIAERLRTDFRVRS